VKETLSKECLTQFELAKSIYRPNQTLNFFVDPDQGHDDYLMSAALCVQGAKDYFPQKASGAFKRTSFIIFRLLSVPTTSSVPNGLFVFICY
jgi:hypothetical protein